MRLEASGWPRKPSVGFKRDGSVRGLHPSGLVERLVKQERDFDGIDPKKHIVRLGHQLGEKKRLVFLEKARQLKVKIANPGTTEAAARQVEEAPPEGESKPKSETIETEQLDVESRSITEEQGPNEVKTSAEDESEEEDNE